MLRTTISQTILLSLLLLHCKNPEVAVEPMQYLPLLPDEASGTVAFVNVNVIPMSDERILRAHTVIVAGGRIAEIGPGSQTVIPDSAHRLDGEGRLYLMPGLADMHVHLFDHGEMIMYLANGVTTVRNLHGLTTHLRWRESLNRNEMLGPRLYTSGPIVDGDPPSRSTNRVIRSADEARQVVAEQKQAGYDFLKIYDNVPRPIYEVLAEEAKTLDLPMVGHVPTPVGISGLLEVKGQKCIEHVEELLPFFNDGRATAGVSEMAQALAMAEVWVDPTMVVHENAGEQHANWPALLARPEMKYMNPETMRTWGWMESGDSRSRYPAGAERYHRTTSFFQSTLVPELHRAGVRLLIGTDSPVAAIIPGFSIMTELRAFVQSGLTPYQSLEAATKNAAAFVGDEEEFGTISLGKSADLILLTANPLENIDNVAERAGVMVRGRWFSERRLTQMLDELAASHGN